MSELRKCDHCGDDMEVRSHEEKQAEFEKSFPDERDRSGEIATICTDCYNEYMEYYTSLTDNEQEDIRLAQQAWANKQN